MCNRRGVSLIEVIVVIFIILTLVALLLPAILAARDRARQVDAQRSQRVTQQFSSLTVIDKDNFQQEIVQNEKPTVVFCYHRDMLWKQQALLDQVIDQRGRNDDFKIVLLDTGTMPAAYDFFNVATKQSEWHLVYLCVQTPNGHKILPLTLEDSAEALLWKTKALKDFVSPHSSPN